MSLSLFFFFVFLIIMLMTRALNDVNRQILLREGVLSPNSKVLTSMASCASLSIPMGGRESVASNVTAGECMFTLRTERERSLLMSYAFFSVSLFTASRVSLCGRALMPTPAVFASSIVCVDHQRRSRP